MVRTASASAAGRASDRYSIARPATISTARPSSRVPLNRDPDKNHEVATFESVNRAVRAYMHNLNTNQAYLKLRRIRAQQRREGRVPDAEALAAGLMRYSERGEAYIEEIRAMIRVNRHLMVPPV